MQPGCYGSLICYDAAQDVCRVCPLQEKCSDAVAATIAVLREEMEIGDYIKRFDLQQVKQGRPRIGRAPSARTAPTPVASRAIKSAPRPMASDLTEAQTALIEDSRFPVKARQEAEKLLKRGLDGSLIRRHLLQGENLLAEYGSRVLAHAAELLRSGGVGRAELTEAFCNMEGASMSRVTARSQAAIVYATFELLGVADKHVDGRLRL